MNASLSLSLPHSDLSFVESDSDGEWSGTSRKRRERKMSTSRTPSSAAGQQQKSSEPREEKKKDKFRRLQLVAAKGISLLFKTHVCDITMKLLWLSVFHSAASRPAEWFEYSTFLGPCIVPTCSLLTRAKSADDLPKQIPALAEFLESCRTPATISILYRFVRSATSGRQEPRPQTRDLNLAPHPPESEGLRDSVASLNPTVEDLHQLARYRQATNAAEYAGIYRTLVHLFKCSLDLHALESSRRFFLRFDETDSEFMRYLQASHLLEARSEEDVERVFRVASRRLQDSLIWYHAYPFIPDRSVKQNWSELVCWTRRIESGHPVLLIRLGSAIRTCEGEKAEEYGRAIVTQVDRGVRKLLKNDGIDQLVTIVDCEGASAANVNRFFALLKNVPITLNKHYPNRLKSLHLVNVPVFVGWLIHLIKRFLHPGTRNKIFVYGEDLNALPEELRAIVQSAEFPSTRLTAGCSQALSQLDEMCDVVEPLSERRKKIPEKDIVGCQANRLFANSYSEVSSALSGMRNAMPPNDASPRSSASFQHGIDDRELCRYAFAFETTVIRAVLLLLFFCIVALFLWGLVPLS